MALFTAGCATKCPCEILQMLLTWWRALRMVFMLKSRSDGQRSGAVLTCSGEAEGSCALLKRSPWSDDT